MKRIMMIKGKSQYDALRIFTDKLAEAFGKKGIEPVILDLSASADEIRDVLVSCVTGHIDAVFSFNCVGSDLKLERNIHAPQYAWLVDHPMRHSHRIETAVDAGLKVIVVDDDHRQYVDKYIESVSDVRMIAHGGVKSEAELPYGERSIDVLFTGSYYKPEDTLKEIEQGGTELSEPLKRIIYGVIELMQQRPWLCEEEAFRVYLSGAGLNAMAGRIPVFMKNFTVIDDYIRRYRRHEVIRTLAEDGIKVHVYGVGWENFSCKAKENLIIGPPAGYLESLDRMADSKIVLNIMPEFKRGTHERVVCAMLNGAVALTDPSSYYKTEFTDRDDIVFYDMGNLKKLPAIVRELLKNEKAAERIALNGQQKALAHHQWSNRADELIEMMGL